MCTFFKLFNYNNNTSKQYLSMFSRQARNEFDSYKNPIFWIFILCTLFWTFKIKMIK